MKAKGINKPGLRIIGKFIEIDPIKRYKEEGLNFI